jgi:hypothetical protein
MTAHAKRAPKTFEHKAGPMPTLKPAAPAPAASAPAPAGPGEPTDSARPASAAARETILRVVEAVKGL